MLRGTLYAFSYFLSLGNLEKVGIFAYPEDFLLDQDGEVLLGKQLVKQLSHRLVKHEREELVLLPGRLEQG